MLRISRGSLSPALNTPLTSNWRPVAALTAILVVAVFVGLVSLAGSPTTTSEQPEPGAINPPAVRDTTGIPYAGTGPAADIMRGGTAGTTERTGIPYVGTGPAAEIIRGGYVDETDAAHTPFVRVTTNHIEIPYVGTGPAADIIRSGSGTTSP